MSASRWFPPIITPRCTVLTCCENRNTASKARDDVDEALRRRPRRHGGGDLGPCVCRKPDRARRILAGTDDNAAGCYRRRAMPVRAQAESILAAIGCDQLHAVSRPG